jgi:ACR3 family arsenite efflux pump ArsB
MKENKFKPLRPVLLLFVAFSAFFIAGKNMLARWEIDRDVLILGNVLLMLITVVSYSVLYRGLQSANPHAFVRAMYGSFIAKFFIIAAAAFIYIIVSREHVNKLALAACMFLYLLYTFIEVSVLTKLVKQKKNA